MPNQKSETSVSIIIPAFNEEQYIADTLRALLNSNYPKYLTEIIVVDNNSSDQTVNIARNLADKVLILKHGNVGAVRNHGALSSKANAFIFLDADCIVDSGWISRGIYFLESDRHLTCGGPCKARKDANWIERLWLLENPRHPRIQPDLLGSCIFVWSETFRSIGGFNEEMTSGEDSDFSQRLRRSGQRVEIISELSVVHLGNPSTLSSFFSRQIWHSENYIRFIRASAQDYTFWITLTFLISFSFAFISLATGYYFTSGCTALVTVGLAGLLSMKRILLTRYKPKNLLEITGILILDYLYLVARSYGIIKSLNPLRRVT